LEVHRTETMQGFGAMHLQQIPINPLLQTLRRAAANMTK